VRVFCEELAQIVTHRVVQCEADSNPQSIIGIVTEQYSNNIVVAKCNGGHLRVGQQLYFLKVNSCARATIESIQLNGVDAPELTINDNELEVGIKTSSRVSKNSKIIMIQDT